MEPADLPAVLDLERRLFPGDPWSRRMFLDELAQPSRYYLVAEQAGRPAGYAGLLAAGEQGDVQTLAVEPGLWGRGIGRALLDALFAEAGRRGVRDLFLEVRADNDRARALYTRLGFTQVGLRRRYYRDRADAITMHRPHPAPAAGRAGSGGAPEPGTEGKP
ncbi:ribosomal protein S18-alanine N-acetyltransferase [Allonocardiopsis opalescens]|nr:ribosomal protein S18-alanine N-acetyltransferase [Allonocardiopsis opalescens]